MHIELSTLKYYLLNIVTVSCHLFVKQAADFDDEIIVQANFTKHCQRIVNGNIGKGFKVQTPTLKIYYNQCKTYIELKLGGNTVFNMQ